MHEITLTPAATIGLFIAHRNHKADSPQAINAQCDADRWFIGSEPLVKIANGDKDEQGNVKSGIFATHEGSRKVRAEDPVFDHLKAALKAAIEKKTFSFEPGQPTPIMARDAHEALEKATKVEVSKEAPASVPKLVEGKSKKTG